MNILRSIGQIFVQSFRVGYAYPMSYICILVLVAIGLISIHVPSFSEYRSYILGKIAMIAGLGYGLFATMSIFTKYHNFSRRYAILIQAIVCIFLLFYYRYMPTNEDDFVVRRGVQYALLLTASYLSVFIAPFVRQKFSHYSFWQFSINVCRSVFVAGIYALVLGAGLSLALWAIDELFGVYVDGDRYATIWVLVGGLVGLSTLLAGIPREIDFEQKIGQYPKVLAMFVQYILGGLSAIYVVILYVYVAKILFEGNWPINTVIIWIFVFAVILVVATYIIFPYVLDEQDHPMTRKIIRRGYILYLPLSIVAYVAILQRLGDYGITEPRYMVVVLNLWFIATALYFITSKKPDFRYVVSGFVLFVILSAVGPRSAFSISEYSQHRIALTRLGRNNLLDENKKIRPLSLNDAQKVAIEEQSRIWDSMSYLSYTHGKYSLQVLLTGDVEDLLGTGYSWDYPNTMMNYMGFSGYSYGGYRYDDSSYFSLYIQNMPENKKVISLQGFSYLLPAVSISTYTPDVTTFVQTGDNYMIAFSSQSGTLDIRINAVRETINLYDRVKKIANVSQGYKDNIPADQMVLEQGKVRIYFRSIYGQTKPSFSIQSMDMDIFIK